MAKPNTKKKSRQTKDQQIKPILVAVDFSENSRTALKWADDLATALGAPLLVLHVVHDPLEAPNLYKQSEGDGVHTLEQAAQQMMQEFVLETIGKDPAKESSETFKTMLVMGVPVTRIIEAAENMNARMIVMGNQGRTCLERLMLGSKAEQVVKLSPLPVTIIKTPED